ncbi:hypothetical protein [uncultured Barnesiella sp.]|jgi:hypothetical protein|uniref:hypothetical protein n=1 Tax=uncultured Barnesiella sp. TaxID=584861 RepID=UPI002610A0D3|nr:hypothetical protein [uncultured Barnesiella sp.]
MDRAEPISVFLMKEGMWIILLFTIGFLALAVILLGIRVFFVKGGRFPSPHISDNKYLRKKGISCAVSTDAQERKEKLI